MAEDLYELGGRVLSVFGPFGSRTLIELPTEVAEEMFPDGLAVSGRTDVVAAAERDIESIRRRDTALAESVLSASMLSLAYEMQDPFNSATSKSMCAKALMEAREQLLALAPPVERKDDLDELRTRRTAERASGGPTA